MSNSIENIDKVKLIFTNFLEEQKQRKTPERFQIIEEIYKRNDHFDIDTLYLDMKNTGYSISRATLYNTVELLLACKLIRKHQFGDNMARYEKSFEYKQHDHLICTQCHQVIEFCDPRLQNIKQSIQQIFDFEIQSHALHLYGLCKNCRNK